MLCNAAKMRWIKICRRNERNAEMVDPRFRCCGCCHVKTGTICLGVYNMVIQMVAIFVVLFAITHPEILLDTLNETTGNNLVNNIKTDVSLSGTKMSDGQTQNGSPEETKSVFPTVQSGEVVVDGPFSATSSQRSGAFSKMDVMVFTRKRVQSGDAHLALALLAGLFFITAMMVCGAVKNRPLYLLPFFCFQVFDFVLACLTAAGHYTWLPNLQDIIQDHPEIPFRYQLLKLDGQWIALCILMAYVIVLIAKAYFIGVVWACYQYLHLRQNSVLTYTTTEDGRRRCDTEMLLPPNYDEALKMPPAYPSTVAPPPYVENNNN